MAFAIWYDDNDVPIIASEITRSDLLPGDTALAASFWRAGLSGWSTAPIETDLFHTGGATNVRRVVIDGKHQGKTLTLQQLRDLISRIAPAGSYLHTLVDDMGRASGAQEPWPPQ